MSSFLEENELRQLVTYVTTRALGVLTSRREPADAATQRRIERCVTAAVQKVLDEMTGLPDPAGLLRAVCNAAERMMKEDAVTIH
jgi:hypothetical protein